MPYCSVYDAVCLTAFLRFQNVDKGSLSYSEAKVMTTLGNSLRFPRANRVRFSGFFPIIEWELFAF